MQQCSIYNKSLRFSRFIYGTIVLVAFFLQNKWLVLAVSLLMILSAFSLSLNIPYQIHIFVEKNLLKKTTKPLQRESGELSFACATAGVLLFIGFLLLQFTEYTAFAWIYLLTVSLMMFVACLLGFCMATMMYILFKKLLYKTKTIHNQHVR